MKMGEVGEIMSADWTAAERQEVIAEALHHPETVEESTAQKAKFRAWLKDPRFQHLWPMLESSSTAHRLQSSTMPFPKARRSPHDPYRRFLGRS